MDEGTMVQWLGVRRIEKGIVERIDGELYVRMKDGHTFRLRDMQQAKSFKVCM